MRWFWQRASEQDCTEQLDELETRLGQLEGASAEREAALLTGLRNATAQLVKMRQAEQKRLERETPSQDDPGSTNEEPEVAQDLPRRARPVPSTAQLARRFRGW